MGNIIHIYKVNESFQVKRLPFIPKEDNPLSVHLDFCIEVSDALRGEGEDSLKFLNIKGEKLKMCKLEKDREIDIRPPFIIFKDFWMTEQVRADGFVLPANPIPTRMNENDYAKMKHFLKTLSNSCEECKTT